MKNGAKTNQGNQFTFTTLMFRSGVDAEKAANYITESISYEGN